MRVDKALLKEYTEELKNTFDLVKGQGDIDILLRQFEEEFSKYIGTKFSFAVNSGTDALHLALISLGLNQGDEVIIPDVTYPAVSLAIKYAGLVPVLVDIKEDDLSMDEAQIKKLINKKTKVILAVHMFSRPANLKEILRIAKNYSLSVIEDVCQAESSSYFGKMLGSFGDLSCFSFSYYKPLSSCGGGGGMICFNDSQYNKIRNYTEIWLDDDSLLGAGKRFARMYLLDLVAVKVKFKYLKSIIQSRKRIKSIYEEELGKIRQIRIFKDKPNTDSVPQNFVIFAKEKDSLNNLLKENGIRIQSPYQPLHTMKAFKERGSGFPVSERYYREGVYLPLFSFMKEKEAHFIIELIKKFYGVK